MGFLQNQYIQTVAYLSALIGTPLMIVQTIREVLRIKKDKEFYGKASKAHLNKVTDLSIGHDGYMSACVLILLVRIIASLFGVVVSALLTIIALFLHISHQANSYVDLVSLVFLTLSSAFLFGTLTSAKRFSDMARDKIAPGSTEGRTLF